MLASWECQAGLGDFQGKYHMRARQHSCLLVVGWCQRELAFFAPSLLHSRRVFDLCVFIINVAFLRFVIYVVL